MKQIFILTLVFVVAIVCIIASIPRSFSFVNAPRASAAAPWLTLERTASSCALGELAGKLDPIRFIRVHRSAVVNIESVSHLEPISHGEFEIVMKNGSRSRISRIYRTQLENRLGQSL